MTRSRFVQTANSLSFTPSLQWRHNECDCQPHDCLLKRLIRRSSKQTPKLRVTGLCVGNSPETGEFPAQRASDAENVSIWWRHHVAHWSKWLHWYYSWERKKWWFLLFTLTSYFCTTKQNSCEVTLLMKYCMLTHWDRDKMDAILQTIFSNAFSWMKMFQLRLKFHWSLFPRVKLTIFQHWFR